MRVLKHTPQTIGGSEIDFPESQRQLLQKWHVSLRQIGYEVGRKRMTAG